MLKAFLVFFAFVAVCLCCVEARRPAKPADFSALMRLSEQRARFSFNAAPDRQGSAPSTWECEHVKPVPSDVRSKMRLSGFYKKYLHAFGIPVVSSNAPSDAALRRACYVVVFLLADRKDVRDWLYRRNGRAGVIGIREGVTTIPEHSWLASWWNQRARGLGGTPSAPISTCGEENIMCQSGDRYPREDIFLHEFTHGIHEIALVNGAIRDFDSRVKARYQQLKRSNTLWYRTYAMSTDREYFAEGTQSYFDVNDYQNPPNGIHNDINTRAKLQRYDSVLYHFNKEVFPCQNQIVKRCEKGVIPRERYYFKMNCDKYGNGILMDFKTKRPVDQATPKPPQPTPPKPDTPPPGTNIPTPPSPNTPPPVTQPPVTQPPVTQPPVTQPPVTQPPPPVTQSPANCVDKHPSCGYWRRTGECSRNPRYMKVYCNKSCGLCGGGIYCQDSHRSCSSWAGMGECRRNPAYMLANCRKSCKQCCKMSILVVMVLNVPSLIVSSTSIHWWILSIYATSRIRQAMCSPPCRWDQITVQTPNLTSCVNCPKCPIGMGLSPQCGSYVDSSVRIECVPCVSGVSYSTSSDISSCSPCSICGENQENLRPCTVDRNSACGKCKRGYYQEPIVYDCWPCSKCCPNSTDDDLVPACLDQGLPRERSCTLDTRNRNCPEVEPYSKSQKNIITKTPLVKNVTDEILNGSRVSDGDASGKVIVRIDLLILVLLGVMFIVISLAVGIIAFLVSSRCHVRACATPQATNLRVARDSGDHEPLPPAQHLLLSENCQKTAVFSV